MQEETTTPTIPDERGRERELPPREAAGRARPDQQPPRGNQDPDTGEVDRGREKLERVL